MSNGTHYAGSLAALNQLIRLHNRSLASYLRYASPEWHRGDERAREVLEQINGQQSEIVERAGELVVECNGVVDYGAYPMVYTGYHDLSFTFLLGQLLKEQAAMVQRLDELAGRTSDDPRIHELVQEALGLARGHLQTLQELKAAPSGV